MNTTQQHFPKQLFIICILALITSCATRKEIVYFQDDIIESTDEIKNTPVLTYKTGDMLAIDVSASEMEAAKPFNLPAVTYNSTVISAQGALKMQTYLIDTNGNINFPVLGALKLAGLTSMEATTLLKKQLEPYLKNPIVNLRISNFTISVLGEVNKPGAYTIQDESISLPEALGLAGDLSIYGQRKDILLIREINGVKYSKQLDLTSINIVNSPYYYLSQNDVIYVKPNKAKVRSSSYTQNNTVLISAIATLATITAILIK